MARKTSKTPTKAQARKTTKAAPTQSTKPTPTPSWAPQVLTPELLAKLKQAEVRLPEGGIAEGMLVAVDMDKVNGGWDVKTADAGGAVYVAPDGTTKFSRAPFGATPDVIGLSKKRPIALKLLPGDTRPAWLPEVTKVRARRTGGGGPRSIMCEDAKKDIGPRPPKGDKEARREWRRKYRAWKAERGLLRSQILRAEQEAEQAHQEELGLTPKGKGKGKAAQKVVVAVPGTPVKMIVPKATTTTRGKKLKGHSVSEMLDKAEAVQAKQSSTVLRFTKPAPKPSAKKGAAKGRRSA